MITGDLKFLRLEHRVKLPFRILSGVLAGFSMLLFPIVIFFEGSLPWNVIISIIFCVLVFLPVAVTGRAPKWFEYINRKL
ncbi:MAG: hypothetical protein CVU52_05265 [Deltaproteobacteria bacterium HGW-Deltaproteobacteria-10]|nr:MAG: hypothetical protein CVU52_05265 [Deltaproteobacteria bacterium HGW-Deltaproteobacteria-10]